MYKVYILQSIRFPEKSYVGKTIKSLENRLDEHNNGLTKSTKPFLPWKVAYYENFYCKLCAEKREMFLKSGLGYRLRKLLVENCEKIK